MPCYSISSNRNQLLHGRSKHKKYIREHHKISDMNLFSRDISKKVYVCTVCILWWNDSTVEESQYLMHSTVEESQYLMYSAVAESQYLMHSTVEES